jgi:hypothetical protein
MSNDKTILRRRNRQKPFTTIANTPLQDESLSLEAVGLLVCVMSLPEHWAFNRAHARHRFKLGREKLDRILKELKDAGYILHTQERDEHGRMSKSVYVFTDEPGQFDDEEPLPGNPYHGGSPSPGKPSHGKPRYGKTAPIKRKHTEKRNIEKGASAPAVKIQREDKKPCPIEEPSPERRQAVGELMKGLSSALNAKRVYREPRRV